MHISVDRVLIRERFSTAYSFCNPLARQQASLSLFKYFFENEKAARGAGAPLAAFSFQKNGLRIIPLASVFLDEFIGFRRAPGACSVGVDGAGRHFFPCVSDAVYNAPGCFDFVAADEEG